MKATSIYQSGLHSVGLAITMAVALWARATPAANILYIVNNPPGTTSDVQVRDRLISQGHMVTVIDDNEPNMQGFFDAQDLILISSSVGSTAVPLNGLVVGDLRTRNVPVVCYEPALNDEFLMQTSADFGNPGGQTALSLAMANESHPLAAGKSGNVTVVNPGMTATFSLSSRPVTIGSEAIVIATNGTPGSTDNDRLAIWAYEKNSRLVDNVTVSPNRRVAFFFNASTSDTAYNMDAFDLFDAAITWALNPGTGPVGIVNPPASQTVLEGQLVRLSLSVTGAPPLTYQWFKGAAPLANGSSCVNGRTVTISGATGPTLSINHAHPNDNGQYHCTVMNSLNSVTSADATLTVTPDIIAPRFLLALCGATLNDFTVVLSEPLNDSCGLSGSVSDTFNWSIRNIADPNDTLGLASVTYTEGSTTIGFTSVFARDPGKSYEIALIGSDLFDTSSAQNLLPVLSSKILSCASNELVSLNGTWKYNDVDVDDGPNWFTVGFNDSGAEWKTGASPFDAKRNAGGVAGANCRDMTLYGLGTVGTCINLTSPVTMTNIVTVDFRTHFTFRGDPGTAVLQLEGKFDDSAQIYLNGSELARISLPAAPVVINRTTYGANYAPAGRTVNDADAQDTGQFLPPSALVSGDNVLAVRLVQANATSSDLTMGLHLYALTPPVPKLSISQGAGMVTLSWEPAIGTLRSTTDLGAPRPWPEVPGAPTSPYTTTASGPFKAFYVTVP